MNSVYNQAALLLEQGYGISLVDGQLIKDTCSNRFSKIVNCCRSVREAEKVVNHVSKLAKCDVNSALLRLGNAVIKAYSSYKKLKPALQRLDHHLGLRRCTSNGDSEYLVKENAIGLEKWQKLGFNEKVYREHYDFVEFFQKSLLLNQMRMTHDDIVLIEGQPSILVEGKYMPFKTLSKTFEIRPCSKYNDTFIFKKGTDKVFTYLGMGKGLVEHHPYHTGLEVPLTTLTTEELQTQLAIAEKFKRKTDGLHDHILQIITIDASNSLTNAQQFFGARHVRFRIIDPAGKMYSAGFLIEAKGRMPHPYVLHTFQGHFRNPDTFDLMHSGKMVVTNIPIAKSEFKKMRSYVAKCMKRPAAFNYMTHNCSLFTGMIVKYATNGEIVIPTGKTIPETIARIVPTWLQKIGRFFARVGRTCRNFFAAILPNCIQKIVGWIAHKISLVFNAVMALMFFPLALVLSGATGGGGYLFSSDNKELVQSTAFLSKWQSWLKFSSYTIHWPGTIQDWQKEQDSTTVLHNDKRLFGMGVKTG